MLGVVLGGLVESNFNRSMVLFDGSISWVWERPIALLLLVATIPLALTSLLWRLEDPVLRLIKGQPKAA